MKKLNNIVTIHGLSNVGKTTIAKHLARRIGAEHTTPISRWKRFLENIYDFPKYSLDTQEGKKYPIGCVTAGDVLRDSYHFWEQRDSGFGARALNADLCDLAESEFNDVVIESIRFPVEVSYIKEHAEALDANLFVFDVTSERGIQHTTDFRQAMCLNYYPPSTPVVQINNDKGLQDTVDEVVDWYRSLSKPDQIEYIEMLRSANDG